MFTQPFFSVAHQRKHPSTASPGLCAGNSPVTGEFPAQRASNAENISIWWRHHVNGRINAICNQNVDPPFSTSNVPTLTWIPHNEALARNRKCRPGGYPWLYKTGPIPFIVVNSLQLPRRLRTRRRNLRVIYPHTIGNDLTDTHDDVIKCKHFPRYWPFVRGIHQWPVDSPHKGQLCGVLMFSLIWACLGMDV